MLPSSILKREFIETTRKRKSLLIKLVVPLIISAPLIMGSPPHQVVSAALVLLIAFLGVFGSGVSLSRAIESGLMERIAITPVSAQRIIFDQVIASVFFDLLQVFPVLALFFIEYGSDMKLALSLFVIVIFTLASANAIGLLLALLAPSSAEVHLFSALGVILLMMASGVFIPLDPVRWPQLWLAKAMPFSHVYQGFNDLLGEGALWQPSEALLLSAVISLVLIGIVMAFSGKILVSED